jgi:hypothetical protein
MGRKILIGLVFIIGIFFMYVSTRPSHFHYEVTEHIKASPEKVFPYISDLKKGGEWSPFEKVDPNMKKDFKGPSDQVGGQLQFAGNKDAGSGSLELLKIIPNESVDLKLIMTAPIYAENLIQYKIKPSGDGVDFTWAMSGDGGFIGKLIGIFIDCEKMIQDQFKAGIANLKTIVE